MFKIQYIYQNIDHLEVKFNNVAIWKKGGEIILNDKIENAEIILGKNGEIIKTFNNKIILYKNYSKKINLKKKF